MQRMQGGVRRTGRPGRLALGLKLGLAGLLVSGAVACGEGDVASPQPEPGPEAPVVITIPPPPDGYCTRNEDCPAGEACLHTPEGPRCGVPDVPAPAPEVGPLGQPDIRLADQEGWIRMGGGQ